MEQTGFVPLIEGLKHASHYAAAHTTNRHPPQKNRLAIKMMMASKPGFRKWILAQGSTAVKLSLAEAEIRLFREDSHLLVILAQELTPCSGDWSG